jgi:hypothetical protein
MSSTGGFWQPEPHSLDFGKTFGVTEKKAVQVGEWGWNGLLITSRA